MAQQDYGPAQPIADVFRRGIDAVNRITGRMPSPPSASGPVDDSWHREMVARANQSMRDAAARDAAAAAAKTPPRTPARTATRAAKPRTAARR